MQTDRYTKIVLTIIAISLAVIIMRDVPIIPEAQAQNMKTVKAKEKEKEEQPKVPARLQKDNLNNVQVLKRIKQIEYRLVDDGGLSYAYSILLDTQTDQQYLEISYSGQGIAIIKLEESKQHIVQE